jgi:hypothetical protein
MDKISILNRSMMYNCSLTGNYWIGLTDVNEEGSWIWMTSMTKLSHSHWTLGEPTALNVYKEIENCVLIYKNNGMWNDSPCSHTNFYICEKSDG